ncbi:MAG: hypothetical protein JJT99_12845 [Rhodobacteraceae bacterium]|nr:hypothetical protein [Paracoccaceae bacterium]
MSFRSGIVAALMSFVLLTPQLAQSQTREELNQQILSLETVCASSPADCGPLIERIVAGLRANRLGFTTFGLGLVVDAVTTASENVPWEQRNEVRGSLAGALNTALARTISPPASVRNAVNTARGNLNAGRAADQGPGDPDPASPT